MAVSGFFGRHNIKSIGVSILIPDEAYAMSEFSLRITIRNNKRHMPAFLIRVRVKGRDALFHYLDPGHESSQTLQVLFEKRGFNKIDSIKVCSVFPFSFFVRCLELKSAEDVLVLPQLVKCSVSQASHHAKRNLEGSHSDSRGNEPGIVSLRPYQSGDPIRHIHWKAAAKADKLLTKEFPSSEAEPVLINFDELQIPDIETRISCAAYTVNKLIKEGRPAGLVIQKRVFKPALGSAHRIKMLRELALYERI
ncbi:MAG: DUF58 domain-containing protein [Nitrospirae bacterium]|nr:DUF58 domain-containing protein [Nitrospirota bacterium]